MNRSHILTLIACLSLGLNVASAKDDDGWRLIWSEEFEQDGAPDSKWWSHEHGFVRNEELQWYQSDNSTCEDGLLVIEGRKERVPNPRYDKGNRSWRLNRKEAKYTSGSINTRGKFEFLYGRLEVRAKIPTASGAWPAIWTLGRSYGWPSNGEIDLMEYYQVDGKPHILANAAWGNNRPHTPVWDTNKIPFTHFTKRDSDWATKFHVWRMDWDEEAIKLYLDDELLNTIPLSRTRNGSVGEYTNPFKTPQFILLNLAMGGNGGEVDHGALPMRYEVDYVRVYQRETPADNLSFKPGEVWPDTNGVHINAHGGGILYDKGTYYWYGEHKIETTSSARVGVRVYSSTDLLNWTDRGVVLPVRPVGSGHVLESGCVIERPKVIYNAKNDKYVMYFHLEHKGKGYSAAEYGVAVGDTPTGEFEFLYSSRSCAGVWPENMNESQIAEAKAKYAEGKLSNEQGLYLVRDFEGGQMARDMTLFVDDDATAYHIFASEENKTLHIVKLTDDYLHHTDSYVRVLPDRNNEAPAIFKRDGVYWMISSDCTGWAPNAARMSRAESMFGPWESLPNPCRGDDANLTFHSQSTYILPIEGQRDRWIFMADRWTPKLPIDGRYIWLPIEFEDGVPQLNWYDEWDMSIFD